MEQNANKPEIVIRRPVYDEATLDQRYGLTTTRGQEDVTVRQRLGRLCRRLRPRKGCCSGRCLLQRTLRCFPVVEHLRTYRWRRWIVSDLVAGISSGVVHVPQSMGFALLAGLPPVYGLYTSVFPGWVYWLFGTSRHISVGTMVLTALMVGAVVNRHAADSSAVAPDGQTTAAGVQLAYNGSTAGPDAMLTTTEDMFTAMNDSFVTLQSQASTSNENVQFKVGVAMSVTLVAGLVQLLMRFLRLSVVADYMSLPLINAFIAGVAVQSIVAQMPFMFGLKIARATGMFAVPYNIVAICRHITETNICALVVSIICVAFLLAIKEGVSERFKSKLRIPIPAELIVVVVATIVSQFAELSARYALPTVGPIPGGFPPPRVPPFTRPVDYIVDGALMAVIGYALSISMAKMMAERNRYEIDADQELVAYSLHNIIPSFFGCFASTQAPPRTLINESCGCYTQLAGFISTLIPLLVVLCLGPLFQALPNAVLGSVVTCALFPLLRHWPSQVRALWPISRHDAAVGIITFTATTIIGVEAGLLIGIGVGVLVVVGRAQTARGRRVVAVGETEIYRPPAADDPRSSSGNDDGDVVVFRFTGPVFFANVGSFRTQLRSLAPTDGKQRDGIAIDVTADDGLKPTSVEVCPIEKELNGALHEDAAGAEEKSAELLGNDDRTVTPAMRRRIVLDCSAVTHVDSMGVTALKRSVAELEEVGVQLVVACCDAELIRTLTAASEPSSAGSWPPRVYPTVHDAVYSFQATEKPVD